MVRRGMELPGCDLSPPHSSLPDGSLPGLTYWTTARNVRPMGRCCFGFGSPQKWLAQMTSWDSEPTGCQIIDQFPLGSGAGGRVPAIGGTQAPSSRYGGLLTPVHLSENPSFALWCLYNRFAFIENTTSWLVKLILVFTFERKRMQDCKKTSTNSLLNLKSNIDWLGWTDKYGG